MFSQCLGRRAASSSPSYTTYYSRIIRGIHSSPKAPKPSPALLSGKQQRYLELNLASLRDECRKRGLKISGRKNELAGRLSAHDATSTKVHHHHSLATSRPVASEPLSNVLGKVSSFSTSSANKAKGDNSTIDYFLFPDPPSIDLNPLPPVSIPVFPDAYGQTSSNASNLVKGETQSQIPVVHEISHQGKTSTIANKVQDGDSTILKTSATTTQHASNTSEFSARDRAILASIGLGTALWWGIGNLFSNNNDD